MSLCEGVQESYPSHVLGGCSKGGERLWEGCEGGGFGRDVREEGLGGM